VGHSTLFVVISGEFYYLAAVESGQFVSRASAEVRDAKNYPQHLKEIHPTCRVAHHLAQRRRQTRVPRALQRPPWTENDAVTPVRVATVAMASVQKKFALHKCTTQYRPSTRSHFATRCFGFPYLCTTGGELLARGCYYRNKWRVCRA
jgi:hypothetical protein